MKNYKNKMGEIPFPATVFATNEVQKQQNPYWVRVSLVSQ